MLVKFRFMDSFAPLNLCCFYLQVNLILCGTYVNVLLYEFMIKIRCSMYLPGSSLVKMCSDIVLLPYNYSCLTFFTFVELIPCIPPQYKNAIWISY